MDDLIFCATIAVECVDNDPINIQNGEPKYLGFVFNVRRNEAESMMDYIAKTLKEYDIPIIDIYVYRSIELPLVKVYDKEEILDRIKKDANYLIQESKLRGKKK